MITVLDTSDFKEILNPESVQGVWFYYVFLKNHKDLSGICCVYLNDKYPSGSVCIGKYIPNDYPDIYSTWKNNPEKKAIVAERFFVSPILRNKGLAKATLLYGATVLEHITKKKLLPPEYGNNAGNSLMSSALGLDPTQMSTFEEGADLRQQFFDQPIDPYIFFGKRVSV
jgi:hypothetical protein